MTGGASFFGARDGLVEPARMQGDAEALGDERNQLAAADRPVAGPVILDEGDDLGGDLVRASRPPALGNQCLQAALAERPVGAHAGRHRSAEAFGGLPEGCLLGMAHHLVADLEEVAWVEELAVGEQGVGDLFRVRVEGSRLPQALGLAVGHGCAPKNDHIIVLIHGASVKRRSYRYPTG